MLGFVELGFRIALEFEGSSSSVQTGSIILPQIAVSSVVDLVVRVAESAMVQICRLRVCLLWALIRIPATWRVLVQICRAWFSNCTRI